MKLTHVHIDGFGKLSDLDFTPSDKLVILYGENEAGKTTFCHFLQALFFDFVRPGAKVRLRTQERDRFRPMHGGPYGGYADMKTQKGHFRIERDFEKNLLRVTDLVTGDDLSRFYTAPDDPGRSLFSVDRNVYRQTVELDTLSDKQLRDANTVIRDQLLGVLLQGDRTFSIQSLYDVLDKRLADIGTDRTPTKPYGQVLARIDDQESRLAGLEEKLASNEKQLAEKDPLGLELKAIQDHQRLQDGLWERAHRAFRQEEEDSLERVLKEEEALRALPASEFSLRRIESLSDRLEWVERSLGQEEERTSLADLQSRRADLMDLYRLDLDAYKPLPLPKRLIALGISFTLFLLVLAIYAFLSRWSILGTAAAVSFFLSLAFFIRLFRGLVKKQKRDREVYDGLSLQVQSRLDYYGLQKPSDIVRQVESLDHEIARTAGLEAERARLKEERRDLRAHIEREMERLEISHPDEIAGVRKRMEKIRALDLSAREIRSQIRESDQLFQLRDRAYALRLDPQGGLESGPDREDLMSRQAFIRERLSALEVIDRESRQLETEASDLRLSLKEAYEKKEAYDATRQALLLTRKGLEEAAKTRAGQGWDKLSAIMGDHLSLLTGGRYDRILINEDFDLSVQDAKGGLYSVNRLSTGTCDQVYFAFGMAVSDLLYEEEPFLILDDRFRHYDDRRALAAMKTLASQSQDRQIFYFTCHKDVCSLVESLGLTIHKIG